MSKWFKERTEDRSPREVVITWTTDAGTVVATLTRSAFFPTMWDAVVTRWVGNEVSSIAAYDGMGTRKTTARQWAELQARKLAHH